LAEGGFQRVLVASGMRVSRNDEGEAKRRQSVILNAGLDDGFGLEVGKMIQEMVAAKVAAGGEYPDLVTQGFVPAHTFRCHACEVSYRLFYRSFGGTLSMTKQAAEVSSFESCVENSHPEHPERIWVKRAV